MRRARALVRVCALAVAGACAFGAPSLPPIPASVPSALGPVRVSWVDSLADESGQRLWGAFAPATRTIYLNTLVRENRAAALQVLFHERCHVRLHDSGLRNVIPADVAQVLCDAVASAEVAEILARP